MSKRSAIPQFDLYGDPTAYRDPGFIHIENISDRSIENGWLIKPHRHGKMLQILCMYSGELEVSLDHSNHSLSGSWAIIIPPGTVHGFRFLPTTKGIVLTIAEPLLSGSQIQNCKRYFEQLRQDHEVIKLNDENALFDQLHKYLGLIQYELKSTDTGHELMLEWLVKMVLMTLRRQLDHSKFRVSSGEASSKMLTDFRSLLEEHFREHWTVQQYAKALHTSVSTLNRLCHETLGTSPKMIIQDRLLTAIKRRLIYTRDSLDQVAYGLGFIDPAYFSRFFKKHEKVSPSAYRQAKNHDTEEIADALDSRQRIE